MRWMRAVAWPYVRERPLRMSTVAQAVGHVCIILCSVAVTDMSSCSVEGKQREEGMVLT
jgi:hypothetical protein